MTNEALLQNVSEYYTQKVRAHGPTSQGVDWNSEASQLMRFEQLCRAIDLPPDAEFSVLDYGCGYAALYPYLAQRWPNVHYLGYDIAPDMLAAAAQQLAEKPRAALCAQADQLPQADFVLASGIFSVKLGHTQAEWEAYIARTLAELDRLALRGFAFNMLTSYSDAERMRPDLYYADPCAYFDHCKRQFSKQVALLHDYPLYEFVIMVRKQF